MLRDWTEGMENRGVDSQVKRKLKATRFNNSREIPIIRESHQ
jgi:hypothetical protein